MGTNGFVGNHYLEFPGDPERRWPSPWTAAVRDLRVPRSEKSSARFLAAWADALSEPEYNFMLPAPETCTWFDCVCFVVRYLSVFKTRWALPSRLQQQKKGGAVL